MIERLPSADDLLLRTPGRWDTDAPSRNPQAAQETARAEPSDRAAQRTSRWVWIKRGSGAALLVFLLLFVWLAFTAPLSRSLKPMVPPRITLLAADGSPIARNGAIVDRPVKARMLPPHVAEAFMAIEDRRFRTHWGVDPRGMARAAWNNVRGGGTQGGSTITQQLAKMTFLSPERNLGRKLREMMIAFWIEAWLSKNQILERYLSNAYFGDNVYGLRAASLHYFDRQPERLTLPQAAMLAGLVKAPSALAPTRNLKAAQARSKLVLAAMADAGYVDEAKVRTVAPATLDLDRGQTLPTGTYFADWAMGQARAATEDAYGDATVRTTLDARLQRAARNAVARAALGKAQVALVAMKANGEVVAMIGGRSYDASPFNRATQAKRQPGSTFKLFVYLAALRGGMAPDSLIDDSPIAEGGYRPKNSGSYRGQITLRQAFARSSNVAAVRLYKQVGGDAVVRAARDLGIKSALANDPTLALGSSGVTLLELTSAYAAVAANRWPVEAHGLPRSDAGLWASLMGRKHSFDARTEDMLRDLLRSTVLQGTAHAANLAIAAFGKTGTSQDNRDALFIGFAGDLIVGVWVGNDDNTPLRGVHGGGLPTRIWRDFMFAAIPGARPVVAPKPIVVPEENPAEIDLPFGDNLSLRLGQEAGVSLNTSIGEVPLNLRLDRDGLSVDNRENAPAEREQR